MSILLLADEPFPALTIRDQDTAPVDGGPKREPALHSRRPVPERPVLPIPALQPPMELCRRLEDRGIATWSQGEGLLDDLRKDEADAEGGSESSNLVRLPKVAVTRALLCAAPVDDVLRVLPRAVVTASRARRLTVATSHGPIDLLPVDPDSLEDFLNGFGLSSLAFAYRPTEKTWCDPGDGRRKFEQRILSLAVGASNPFAEAPRRFWITARLLSQYELDPSRELLEAARAALPSVLEALPKGAPARREINRILFSPDPSAGLAFLRESGVSHALFPGVKRAGEARAAKLDPMPALRWAAWLDGTAIQRAIVKLRMPHALARSIERLHRAHPIDRTIESLRDGGTRKVLQRLRQDEIEGLIQWRRHDLNAADQNEKTRAQSKRLDGVEAELAKLRLTQHRSRQVRALALDGKTVMNELGAGPGPHVGRALAYLAQFVERHPDANDRVRLLRELRDWMAKIG